MKILFKRSLKFVLFGIFLFASNANSAQVNISGCIYQFDQMYKLHPAGPHRWHQMPGNINGTHILSAEDLRDHFIRIWNNQELDANGIVIPQTDILRELARMLLAQFYVAGPNPRPHNIVANVNGNYSVNNMGQIWRTCIELKTHLLEHGHLGYFPIFSVLNENPQVKVNKLVPRGIFRVRPNIMQRIMNAQRDILNWLNIYPNGGIEWEFFNRIPNYLYNLGFCIDPIIPFPLGLAPNIVNALNVIIPRQPVPAVGLNLENFTNRMINKLLTDNTILNTVIYEVENNRFSIDITYNNLGNGIGINRNGMPTNTVKIVVQVLNGVVSIVTMYPI